MKGRVVVKIQESAENYLETILVLKKKNGVVRSIDIANDSGCVQAQRQRRYEESSQWGIY